MASKKVFACDDLRREILSYIVCDNYTCCECGNKCSPLDSVLLKEKKNEVIHFDENGNEYIDSISGVSRHKTYIPEHVLLCSEITTEFHCRYNNKWIHKWCFSNTNKTDALTKFIKEYETDYARTKAQKTKLINLIEDGNLLFIKHRLKISQEKANYYEHLWYKIMVNDIIKNTIQNKEIFEKSGKQLKERIEYIKKVGIRRILDQIRPELFTKLVAKMYINKQINYKTFKNKLMRCEYAQNIEL